MSEITELHDIRAAAEGVLERARHDAGYLASLRDDPVAVLRQAGLSDAGAQRIGLEEWGYGDDTEGFLKPYGGPPQPICKLTCDRYTCWASLCDSVPLTSG